MFKSFLSFITAKSRGRRRSCSSGHYLPAMEILEHRVLLDADVWVGSGRWFVGGNWSLKRFPDYSKGDIAEFLPKLSGGSSQSCTIDQNAEVKGIKIATNYGGKIVIKNGVTVTTDTYNQADAIVQVDGPGDQLTINATTASTWTGGTIQGAGFVR